MKRISIFIQLVLIMFIISAIPAISVIYINSNSMRENSEEAIAEAALNKIQANRALGDEMLTNIVYDALDLILAKQYYELNGITSYDELNSDYKYVNAALKMKSSLTDLSERNELIHSVFYYMDDADYVISANQGLVRAEYYDSLEWLADAVPNIRGAEGIWYPRRLEAEKGADIELVSYLYRSSSLYTSARVTIVINVYEQKLSNLIYADSSGMNGEGFLINGNGDVIAHSDSQYLYTNLSKDDYVVQIIKSRERNGYGITPEGSSLYTYEKSELYDWIYVNVYSLEQVYSESRQIIRAGIGMTLLIIFFGAICAVLLSLRISRPIRKLTDEIKGFSSERKNSSSVKNEIVYLSDVFGEIKEREKDLKNSLTEREESARRGAISSLFHGETLREKEQTILESYFPYSHFMVCMIATDGYLAYQDVTSHEERKSHRIILYETLRSMFPAEYRIDSVRYNSSSIGLLINLKDYDSNRVKSLIYSSLSCTQKHYREETGYSLSFGVSQVHNYVEGIKVCTDEACEALKYRLISGSGTIAFFRIPKETVINIYDSYQHEKRIMNYLELGDIDKIRNELETVVKNLKQQDSLSTDHIMLVFNQMIGSILIYLGKHNYNVSTVLGAGQRSLYSILAELETMDEIKDWLEDVCQKIAGYQKRDISEEDTDYTGAILHYIRNHYSSDIDFEQLAKDIGISYSYARKIIRENTGRSLIDNLNLIRIEAAKALLDEKEHSVVQIAEAVGYHNVQSLYRFFKKYEGVSPGDYKTASTAAEGSDSSTL